MGTIEVLSPVRAHWINTLNYYRKFTPEDVLGGHAPPDIGAAIVALIEAGETAWEVPEFERVLSDLLYEWVLAGWLIRASLTAQWLLGTTTDAENLRWLQAYAIGAFWEVLNPNDLARSIIGVEADFLYPLQVDRLIRARQYRRAYKVALQAVLY